MNALPFQALGLSFLHSPTPHPNFIKYIIQGLFFSLWCSQWVLTSTKGRSGSLLGLIILLPKRCVGCERKKQCASLSGHWQLGRNSERPETKGKQFSEALKGGPRKGSRTDGLFQGSGDAPSSLWDCEVFPKEVQGGSAVAGPCDSTQNQWLSIGKRRLGRWYYIWDDDMCLLQIRVPFLKMKRSI